MWQIAVYIAFNLPPILRKGSDLCFFRQIYWFFSPVSARSGRNEAQVAAEWQTVHSMYIIGIIEHIEAETCDY